MRHILPLLGLSFTVGCLGEIEDRLDQTFPSSSFTSDLEIEVVFSSSVDPGLVRIALFPATLAHQTIVSEGQTLVDDVFLSIRTSDGELEARPQTLSAIEQLELYPFVQAFQHDASHWSMRMSEIEATHGAIPVGDSFVLVGWLDENRNGRLDVPPHGGGERGFAPHRSLRCEERLYPMWLLHVMKTDDGWLGGANADGVPCTWNNEVSRGETDGWVLTWLP